LTPVGDDGGRFCGDGGKLVGGEGGLGGDGARPQAKGSHWKSEEQMGSPAAQLASRQLTCDTLSATQSHSPSHAEA
jgi:hypothetical protein